MTLLNMKLCFLCIATSLIAVVSTDADDDLVVRTIYGQLRGIVLKSVHDYEYLAFMGIPYAKPPIGELRFQPPSPPNSWEGEFDASKDGVWCAQHYIPMLTPEETKEDCLTLNVYTPKDSIGKNLDVMVHIHGGALMMGTGIHDGFDAHLLVARGVIVVSINYRVGIFGFLSTGDDVVPGNNGLKDQVMALRWVKDNIAAFGGNPDSVTIFGCSGGGWSVHAQYLSPLSRGLFHRGIADSGVATTPAVLTRNAPEKAKTLGKLLTCPTDNSRELIECLRGKNQSEILKQLDHFYTFSILSPLDPFGLVVEPSGSDRFLTKHPYTAIEEGDVAAVPFITGVDTDEGSPFGGFVLEDNAQLHKFNSDPQWFSTFYEYEHVPDEKRDLVGEKIREFYLKGMTEVGKENYRGFMDAYGDRVFLAPMFKAIQKQASHDKSPIYAYEFAFRFESMPGNPMFPNSTYDYGVAHGSQLYYYTEFLLGSSIPASSENEKRMVNIVTSMWTNFAKTGNPTPDSSLGFKWDPVTTTDVNFLKFDKVTRMEKESSWPLERIKFWDMIHEDDLKTTYESNRQSGAEHVEL